MFVYFVCPRPRPAGRLALVAVAALGALGALAAGAHPARARHGDVLPGPIAAEVVEVVDGDTLAVRARIWLGQEVSVLVRLAGVDAPELRGACARERRLARAARDLVAARIGGRPVTLRDVRYGKFAGRVVARVRTADGAPLAEALIRAGLGRAYDGRRRLPWCAPQAATP